MLPSRHLLVLVPVALTLWTGCTREKAPDDFDPDGGDGKAAGPRTTLADGAFTFAWDPAYPVTKFFKAGMATWDGDERLILLTSAGAACDHVDTVPAGLHSRLELVETSPSKWSLELSECFGLESGDAVYRSCTWNADATATFELEVISTDGGEVWASGGEQSFESGSSNGWVEFSLSVCDDD